MLDFNILCSLSQYQLLINLLFLSSGYERTLAYFAVYFKMFQSVTAVSIELFYFIVNYFVILSIIYHFGDFRRFSAVKNYGRLWIHDVYILDTEKVSN